MEWCEELYREMSVEEFIRRGMRAVLAMILFLSMVVGVSAMTSGKELPVIHAETAGAVSVCERALPDAFEIFEDTAKPAVHEEKTEPTVIMPDELVYEKILISDGGAVSPLPGNVSADIGTTDVPPSSGEAEVLETTVSDNDMPLAEFSGEESSVPGIPITENNGIDAPAADIPVFEGSSPETPESDNLVSDWADDGNVVEENTGPGTEENAGAEAGVSGFIVDESGMICGISDMSLAVSGMCLYLPNEGCTGIAHGAFAGATEEIIDVYIPSNITNIEVGAFIGLPYVCKYEVEAGNSMYYTENGVLLSEGGSCLFAFPAGRIGTYSVPAGVTRFACDAFDSSMLSKLDTRSCALEDMGNLPENIIVQ